MTEQVTLLPLGELHGGDNVRRQMDKNSLDMLARSIAASGVHEPLIVRKNDDGYEVVAGHRRLAAAHIAEVDTVPVIVRELDDEAVDEIMLVENLQREDLVPSDEAFGYARLKDRGWTVKDLADKIGRSQQHVAARVRLLHLPREWQEDVDRGDLSLEKADDLAKTIVSKEFRELTGLLEAKAQKMYEEDPEAATLEFNETLDELERELRTSWNPVRTIERLLSDEKRAAAVQRVREKIEAKGYELIEQEFRSYGRGRWPKGVTPLEVLGLDKEHRKEPCHGFGVSASEAKAVELCTDQKRHRPEGDSGLQSPVLEEEVVRRQQQEEEKEAKLIEDQKRRDAVAALIASDHKDLEELALYATLSEVKKYELEFIVDIIGIPSDEEKTAHDGFVEYVTKSKANARRALYALSFHRRSAYMTSNIGDWKDRLGQLVEEVKD